MFTNNVPEQNAQPRIQRDSYLFIEYFSTAPIPSDVNIDTFFRKVKIQPDLIRDNGIASIISYEVSDLVKKGFEVLNVYVGSLM